MAIDAYCHVGLPRFGSAEDAWTVWELHDIERGVWVLGPEVPDYATLFAALATYGDRVRGIGIPFGRTDVQVREIVGVQLRAGVLGLRLNPEEVRSYPEVLAMLGSRGRWAYAVGAVASNELIRRWLAWLETYPEARIAAPHFLKPEPLTGSARDPDLVRALVGHPRFYPIFSRHGGVGSTEPYPHSDLRTWVEAVIDLAGWDHVMWGSEYPVLYWRDETMRGARDWLDALLDDVQSAEMEAFLSGNAARAFFASPPPPREPVEIPAWVADQFDRGRTVPLFPGGVNMPMHVYHDLHHRYVAALEKTHALTFADFVIQQLSI